MMLMAGGRIGRFYRKSPKRYFLFDSGLVYDSPPLPGRTPSLTRRPEPALRAK
jgi:hypothetical protein